MTAVIQVKRGTAAAWASANTVLAAGEVAFETDTKKIKIGDGSTAWNSLGYAAAPVNSPEFTGTPTAPTANAGTNTTQVATTAFVTTAVNNVVDAAPGALDTLNELAAALGDDANYATTITNALATKASLTGAETLTNKTLTSPILNSPILKSPEERLTVSATAATGTVNFDALTQGILYYTSNASGNWTLNVRGDGSNTLNSILTTGDSITIVFLATQGSTAYYASGFTIDGSAVTPKYQGGTAWNAGNASSIDSYVYTIIKTGSATFTVLASQTKFA
jgi:Major tropism determinant N-terminal domain